MTDKQPEALRLADAIDPGEGGSKTILTIDVKHAAAELRRLHAVNAQLLEALETARDYVSNEVLNRQAAYKGYPNKWRVEVEDLAAVDAAIKAAKEQA